LKTGFNIALPTYDKICTIDSNLELSKNLASQISTYFNKSAK